MSDVVDDLGSSTVSRRGRRGTHLRWDRLRFLRPWMCHKMAVGSLVLVVTTLILSRVAKISGLENLAFERPSLQSSLYEEGVYNGLASRAVDGDPDPNVTSCSHTNAEFAPWWQVDLGTSQPVSTVVIVNRGDCCAELLKDFYVGMTNTSAADSAPTTTGPSYDVFAFHPGALTNLETFLYTTNPPVYGRYLVVQLTARDFMTICEVEVYSDVLVNEARGRPAWQGPPGPNPASLGVDGVVWSTKPAQCSQTNEGDRPWWAVDMGKQVTLAAVTLLNRGDCCGEELHDFYIGVSESSPMEAPPIVDPLNYEVCTFHAGTLSHRKQLFTCDQPPVIGRYLVIQLTSNASTLTLCEVEVLQGQCSLGTAFNSG